jgi:peptide/nickel transport system permease protein
MSGGDHSLFGVVIRRLALSIPLLLAVSALVFILESLTSGNIAVTLLGLPSTSGLPASAYSRLEHQLGIDKPLWTQYWDWLDHALHGDLGNSLITKEPVVRIIDQRLPVTMSLLIGALIIGVVVGVTLGVLGAVSGGALGKVVDVLAMAGWVIPVYWLAAELVIIFAVKLGWLPATGYVSFSQSVTDWFRALILPVLALSLGPIGMIAKFTREAMLDALSSEYIRMARASGLSPTSIVLRHSLKSAAIPVVTAVGLWAVGLLAGTVFVETVFSLPGLGSGMVSAAQQHDVTVVQGIAVFFTLIIVIVNLGVDVAYGVLNPKVHVS